MGLDYHTDRIVRLSTETQYKTLYGWCLREFDDADKQVGRDQIPWNWTLVFTAFEVSMQESFSMEKPLSLRLTPEEIAEQQGQPFKIEDRDRIRAKLNPGYFGEGNRAPTYSMFGTERKLKSFELMIIALDDESKDEGCKVWGSLSYTSEVDFHDETEEDAIQIYLTVKPSRFRKYAEIIRENPPNILQVRLNGVHGFYSEWSPSIRTSRVKVLANTEDHKVQIPDGCTINPPVLGDVGEFELLLLTRGAVDKPGESLFVDANKDDVGSEEPHSTPVDSNLAFQRSVLKAAQENEQALKRLQYAAWVIAALLALLILSR